MKILGGDIGANNTAPRLKMMKASQEIGLPALGVYWMRANYMLQLAYTMLEEADNDVEKVNASGNWIELETYIVFWLSGLFVVVEGWNKLKLHDPEIRNLLALHTHDLKNMRHEIFHFHTFRNSGTILEQLNWADELHHRFGFYLKKNLRKLIISNLRPHYRIRKAPFIRKKAALDGDLYRRPWD